MISPGPREDRRAVTAPRAYTAKEAAGIIGGNCKESWLKTGAREGRFPSVKLSGAWNFTDAHIDQIIALCEVPARTVTAASPAPAKSTPAKQKAAGPPAPLFPPAGIVQIRPREPRKRDVA